MDNNQTDAAQTVHILTDPTRFRLLQLLLEHHYCVRALAKKMGISEPAVSQHMRILKKCGVVYGVKIGCHTHYRIDQERVALLFSELSRQLAQRAPAGGGAERWDCSCEFLATCARRDAKLLEEQGYAE